MLFKLTHTPNLGKIAIILVALKITICCLMFKKQSIAGRVALSKIIGLVVGGLIILLLPLLPVEATTEFKIGFMLLVMMMSIMIGFFGMFAHHPLFSGWKLHWWSRGPLVGMVFFLILVLLAKDELQPFMSLDIVIWTGLASPYWALIDGAILGGIVGYITTKICGEGDLPTK